VIPIICIALALRLGHATGGAHALIRTCCGLVMEISAMHSQHAKFDPVRWHTALIHASMQALPWQLNH